VNSYLAVAGLVVLTVTLVVLPLVPGLRELHRKSDAAALSVIQQHTGEIRYFADSFRAYIKSLEPTLRECGITGRTAAGIMPDGTEYVVLGSSNGTRLPVPTQTNHPALIAAPADLSLPSESIFSRDIYACGKLTGGAKNQYRAVLAEKSVYLGPESTVMRWVHAVGEFSAASGCRLYGRVSSDRSIRLQAGCSFLRLNAPRIETGQGGTAEVSAPQGQHASETSSLSAPQRLLHDGDFEIAAGEIFRGNLVVRGNLHIGSGARVYGSVKSDQELVLDSGMLDQAVDAGIRAQEPAFVAKYAFELAQGFNVFYHKHHILSETDEQKRAFLLGLTELVERQMVRALGLLGIEAPEKM
jgi:hypothetical protein